MTLACLQAEDLSPARESPYSASKLRAVRDSEPDSMSPAFSTGRNTSVQNSASATIGPSIILPPAVKKNWELYRVRSEKFTDRVSLDHTSLGKNPPGLVETVLSFHW